ncbi:MAG: hypothetical protein U1F61_21140 [Opitutaceae bacterium]
MAVPHIPTATRLTYARGYLGLGLVKEAFRELNAIVREDRRSLEVRKVRVEWGMAARAWNQVITWARPVTEDDPGYEPGWIALAYALRELNHVEDAKTVLLAALPHHQGTSGVLHYNLACYECLLGNHLEARKRLARACKMDPSWKDAAKDDPDLKDLFASVSSE